MNNAIAKDEVISLRDRIFNAAIDEFAEKGYKAASTNSIMKKAGVSKGLIFHYFESKKNLYLECARYFFDDYIETCLSSIDLEEPDFFERVKALTAVKLELMKTNMKEARVISDAYTIMRGQTIPELNEYYDEKRAEVFGAFNKNIDTERFKKFDAPENILTYVFLVIEAVSNKYLDRYNTSELIIENSFECAKELDVIYEMIKYGIYEK